MIINYKQLAFLLDIEAVHALEKIIFAYCQENKKALPPPKRITKESPKPYTVTDYKKMDYPQEVVLSVLEKHTGLTLAPSIRDIQENYLIRSASKKWILCDFPEKELKTKPKDKIRIPPGLKSLLNENAITTIQNEWHRRYGIQH
jgi:proteasome lid subunit RPN8/RPN11